MNLVAVSQRVDHFQEREEWRDALDQRLVEFLLCAGFLAVPIPNSFGGKTIKENMVSTICQWLDSIKPKAIILSGGNDVGNNPSRDTTEEQLITYAYKRKLPLLGICHGMQVVGKWAGTKLYRIKGHVATRHQLLGKINTEVNSYHDYCLAECPEGFEVLAYSENGVIEAIRHTSLDWEGWMWHPEREEPFSKVDIERIKELVK